jgi:hypothetical protein
MKLRIQYFLAAFYFVSLLAGQSFAATISGAVYNDQTKNALPGVYISLEKTRHGTSTDTDGKFELSGLPAGEDRIVIEMIGYQTISKKITLIKGQKLDLGAIYLREKEIVLKDMVVTAGSYSLMGGSSGSKLTLSEDNLKMMGWAEDVTRAVQRIPGITSNDFAAKFNVRGGESDEVLVQLDGMQILKPFHQKDFGGGLFSTVDISALRGVDMYTGGFSAEYGDRMSGVLNMHSKNPRDGESKTIVGLSVMNLGLFSMGNFADNRGKWLFSARRGYLDVVNNLMGNAFKLDPTYYDILGKASYQLNDHHNLALHVFLANDAYNLDEKVFEPGLTLPSIDKFDSHYGNNYAWFTLKSSFGKNIYARSILYAGIVDQKRYWYVFDNDPHYHTLNARIDDNRDFSLMGFKQDWDFNITDRFFLKAGFDIKRGSVNYEYSKDINNEFVYPGNVLSDTVITGAYNGKISGNIGSMYLTGRFRILKPLTLETGIRFDYSEHSNDKLFSPRASMVYAIMPYTNIRAGWGYFYQSQQIQELDVQFDETAFHKAEKSEHFVLGIEHQPYAGMTLRAEAYVKKISNLPDYYINTANIDEFFPEARTDLIRLSVSESRSSGIELFFTYDTKEKLSWWISYVYAKAWDNVTDIGYNGILTKKLGQQDRGWDQRHTFNVETNYRYSDQWHFNFNWYYRTGWPFTDFTVGQVQREDGTFAYYRKHGTYNASRYPAYHRLDIRINRYFYFERNGKLTAFLQVINAYDNVNVSNYDHETRSDVPFKYDKYPETWFGITPFVGVSWEF